jgi:hypothetical protein
MPPEVQDDIIAACKSVPLKKLAEMMECACVCVCVCVCLCVCINKLSSAYVYNATLYIDVTYVYEDKIQEEFL